MCPASLVTWYNYSYKNNRNSINKKTYNIWGHHKNPENPVQRHTTTAREIHTFNTYRNAGEQNTPHTDLNALLQEHIRTLQLCLFTERWHIVNQASWVSVKPLAQRDVEPHFLQEVATPQRSAGESVELWHHLYFPFESHKHYFSSLFRVVYELHVDVLLPGCFRWLLCGFLLAWVDRVHPQVSFWSCKYGSGPTFNYV